MDFNCCNPLDLNQKTILPPKLQQSIEILQMSQQELTGFIEQQVLENPVMEVELEYDELEPHEKLRKKLDWIDEADVENRVYYGPMEEDEGFEPGWMAEEEQSLTGELLEQLDYLGLDKKEHEIAEYIIESLDENGYLDEDMEDIARDLNVTVKQVEAVLHIVQTLEPYGVGARNLKECLVLQLKNRGFEERNLYLVVEKYLTELGKNKLSRISKELGVPIEEVKRLQSIISTLTPHPGGAFGSKRQTRYIKPDIVVVKFKDYFEVMLNDLAFPRITVSNYYKNLLGTTLDMKTRKYISNKIQQTCWMMKAIEQRNDMLINMAKVIVDIQKQYFKKGPGHLVPMTLKDIAEKLSVHESTVSRAIRDKYLYCAWGAYPLKYFFSYDTGAGRQTGITSECIKAVLREVIEAEDKDEPYSDREIADILQQKGVKVARRTVAKYREELGLPVATGRKKY